MERELWAELSANISLIDHDFPDNPDFELPTALIVRCKLWAILHDRPTSWASLPQSWNRQTRPAVLPSQSTLSRRPATAEYREFMQRLAARLAHRADAGSIFKRLDAKPLPIAAHSTDPDAGFGRGAGAVCNGYKLHTIWAGGAMPLVWRVAPLNVSEQEMARRMLGELTRQNRPGLVYADAAYDKNVLYKAAAHAGNRLIAPRAKPGTGLGHQDHAPDRLRAITQLEGVTETLSQGQQMMQAMRGPVERDFGNSTSFGGGLQNLPSWVRRHWRVKQWVEGKLMINAARIRLLDRRKAARCA